jgi:hypothetical protein
MPVSVLVALISASPAILNAVAAILKDFEAKNPGQDTTPAVHQQIAAVVLPDSHPLNAPGAWDADHAGE